MNKLKKVVCIVATCIGLTSISAAEFEGNIAMANDYIWRGMSQTGEEPAVSGGFDISSEYGIYFGTWGSNVEFGDDAAMELDYYFGYAGEKASFSYDIGFISYRYPGETDLNFEEIYVGVGYGWAGFTFSFGQDSAPDNKEFSLSFGDSGLGLTYGDYDEYGDYTLLNYELPKKLAGLSIGIGWSEFSAEEDDADEDGFVVTFSM